MPRLVKRVLLASVGAILCAWISLSLVPYSRAGPYGRTNHSRPAWSQGQSRSPVPEQPRFSGRRGERGRKAPDGRSRDENKHIKRQYREWQSLSPEEKERMRRRMEQWRHMSPREQQRYERRYQQWNQLPPEERKQLEKKLQHWDRLTPDERDRIRRRFKE